MAETKTIWFRLTPVVLKKLSQIAKKQRRSRANLMALAMEDYVERWELDNGKVKSQ